MYIRFIVHTPKQGCGFEFESIFFKKFESIFKKKFKFKSKLLVGLDPNSNRYFISIYSPAPKTILHTNLIIILKNSIVSYTVCDIYSNSFSFCKTENTCLLFPIVYVYVALIIIF